MATNSQQDITKLTTSPDSDGDGGDGGQQLTSGGESSKWRGRTRRTHDPKYRSIGERVFGDMEDSSAESDDCDGDDGGDTNTESGVTTTETLTREDADGSSWKLKPLRSQEVCPDCGDRVVSEGDEMVCRSCGLVVAEYRIDHGPSLRKQDDGTLAPSDRYYGTTAPSNNPGGGQTNIGSQFERSQESTKGVAYGRLAIHQDRELDNTKSMLRKALPEIKRMCAALELEALADRACLIYRKAQSVGFVEKRCMELVAGVSIYVACRERGLPRLPEEIAEVMRLTTDSTIADRSPRARMLQTYRKLLAEESIDIEPSPLEPRDYLPRLMSELDLSPVTREIARKLLTEVEEKRLIGGRRPSSVAAAVVALALQEGSLVEIENASSGSYPSHVADTDISQREVAEKAWHTVSTIRSARYTFRENICLEDVVLPISSASMSAQQISKVPS